MDFDFPRAGKPACGPPQNSGALPPLDLSAWVRRCKAPAMPESRQAVTTTERLRPSRRATDPAARPLERAASYLGQIPAAISGQRGHDRTFHAACVLIKGFALSIDEARPLLRDWNERCTPPWSEAELEHKLKSAEAAPDKRPRGYLVRESRTSRGIPERPPAPGPARIQAVAAPGRQTPTLDLCPEGQETNPHRLADRFLSERFSVAGEIGLRFWRDEFHSWDGSAFRRIPIGEIRALLSRWLAEEFDRLYEIEREGLVENGERSASRAARRPPRLVAVTSRLVTDVVQAVSGLVLITARECPGQPAWISRVPGTMPTVGMPGWPVDEVLPAPNALVHLPSFADGRDAAIPPTPRFFNAFALDYDFVPTAPEPAEWKNFLQQVWEDDEESIACLQEWFGYLLTPDTRQQKILMMVGPKRSGRGTIARVLKALAGPSNVVNPTLATLARPFGLAPLIDKPVAIFPDARLSSRPDNAAITESLLSISGEDDQTVDRKHLPAWTGRLPTRFVLISNELPRLRDASGALASRLILLRFTRSFYGQEDVGLFDRLSRELPGILLWAITGWKRLRHRGWFIQPRSGRDLLAAMGDLASPISSFLRDQCVLEPNACVPAAALYETWRSWCQEHGRDVVGDEAAFGRDLHAAIPGLSKSRLRKDSVRVVHYTNIRLRTPLDPDPEVELNGLAGGLVPLNDDDHGGLVPF
jgi:putative DNA primase/helicase